MFGMGMFGMGIHEPILTGINEVHLEISRTVQANNQAAMRQSIKRQEEMRAANKAKADSFKQKLDASFKEFEKQTNNLYQEYYALKTKLIDCYSKKQEMFLEFKNTFQVIIDNDTTINHLDKLMEELYKNLENDLSESNNNLLKTKNKFKQLDLEEKVIQEKIKEEKEAITIIQNLLQEFNNNEHISDNEEILGVSSLDVDKFDIPNNEVF